MKRPGHEAFPAPDGPSTRCGDPPPGTIASAWMKRPGLGSYHRLDSPSTRCGDLPPDDRIRWMKRPGHGRRSHRIPTGPFRPGLAGVGIPFPPGGRIQPFRPWGLEGGPLGTTGKAFPRGPERAQFKARVAGNPAPWAPESAFRPGIEGGPGPGSLPPAFLTGPIQTGLR